MKQCVAVLGGELPAASVHQTITESLRWLKQSVSLTSNFRLLVCGHVNAASGNVCLLWLQRCQTPCPVGSLPNQ